MKTLFNRFVREEQGQDLIEYALLAGLISLASVIAVTAVGTALDSKFTEVADQLTRHRKVSRGGGAGLPSPNRSPAPCRMRRGAVLVLRSEVLHVRIRHSRLLRDASAQ